MPFQSDKRKPAAASWPGHTSEKITPSRHQLTRRETPRRTSKKGIMVHKTQDESACSIYNRKSLTCPDLASSVTSYGSSRTLSSSSRNVLFDKVGIREYPRCVGDNPGVKAGPPMSMEWDHQSYEEHSVEKYEDDRDLRRSFPGPGVKRIKGPDRIEMLTFEWQASLDEIMNACNETKAIRKQRERTATTPRHKERVEEFIESTKKSFKKVFKKS